MFSGFFEEMLFSCLSEETNQSCAVILFVHHLVSVNIVFSGFFEEMLFSCLSEETNQSCAVILFVLSLYDRCSTLY